MSILIIGDIHFKTSNERQTSILMVDIAEIISKNDIAFVVILGDTLDNHGKIDMECLCRASDLFEMIMSTRKHLFVLIGNHDRKNNKDYMSNRHPFRGWNGKEGITIIDKTFVCDFPVRKIGIDSDDIMKFCFVPYVPNDMYMKALEDANVNVEDISMFFSHQEFAGCKINKLSGAKCDQWPLDYPLNISGHIHDYEVVQDNLIYLGTPFQHTYSDASDKGVFLLDLKSGDFKLTKKELNIPQKTIWKVHYSDLATLELDPKLDIRLDIYGPTSLVREIMSRPEMVSKFGHVTKKYKEESKDEKAVGGKVERSMGDFHFYNSYMAKIGNDPRMFGVHLALFKN